MRAAEPDNRRGRRRRVRRTGDGERGASIVEFALIAPLLFMVLFGIVDFGIILSEDIGIRQGVREGARQATVAEWGSRTSCSLNGHAAGSDASSEYKRLICLTKDRSDMPDSKVRVAVRYVTPEGAIANYPAGTDRPPVGGGLLVCATAPMESTTGFFNAILGDRNLRTSVVMRIERAADKQMSNTQEVDPSGDGWSWCTP